MDWDFPPFTDRIDSGSRGILTLIGNARLNKTYAFPPSNLTIPSDAASIARGEHRVDSLCAECHGEDLGGINNWFSASPIGTIERSDALVHSPRATGSAQDRLSGRGRGEDPPRGRHPGGGAHRAAGSPRKPDA